VGGHQNIMVTAGAAGSHILLNLLLIPRFGLMGPWLPPCRRRHLPGPAVRAGPKPSGGQRLLPCPV